MSTANVVVREQAVNQNLGGYKTWFFFMLLFLVIDYGRLQDIVPIGFLRPGLITELILSIFLISSGKIWDADSKQTRMIVLFIILLGILVPFARNNYYAFETTLDMMLFMPFILSAIVCVNSIERLRRLILFLIILMTYVSIYGFLNRGLGSGSYFKDENDLALFINTWLPFSFFLYSAEKDRFRKFIYGMSLVIGILTVVVSFSRGGFLGLLGCAIVSWLFSKNKVKTLAVLCLLGLIFFVYASNYYSTEGTGKLHSYLDEMHTISDTSEGTASGRIESWKAAWKMFLDYPFGVGGGNFPVRFPDYQTSYFTYNMWGRAAHSLWFTIIPELGIFGVIIYLLLIYYNFTDIAFISKVNQNYNQDSVYLKQLSGAFLASFAGFFISGTFLSVLYYPHFWYLTGILVAAKKISQNLSVQQTSDSIRPSLGVRRKAELSGRLA
jgi:hypothetical protein